jgi:hypothetical protein
MRVMIQLRMDVALELQSEYSHPQKTAKRQAKTEKLLNTLSGFDVTLTPVHPGQTHELLVSQFMIEAKDRKSAERIISQLQQFDIVEASYFTPDDELPGPGNL